jgi:hypothetical protein
MEIGVCRQHRDKFYWGQELCPVQQLLLVKGLGGVAIMENRACRQRRDKFYLGQ